MTKTVTATQARKNFFQLIRSASIPGSFVRITLNDAEPVIMMSEEEWEGWIETMEILSNPDEATEIKKAIQEHKSGTMKTIDWDDVEQI